jgi:dienelactone hydrolase
MLWLHGRTVNKELGPGRYLRWIRAGIGACAIDLPGHGERFDADAQRPERTLYVVRQAIGEIDHILRALTGPEFRLPDGRPAFDPARIGIGGMSAGGMVTLRRLCEPHPFVCAAVESTAGDFSRMPAYDARYDRALIDEIDPLRHLANWRAIPLLALHSEADEWVPVDAIRAFTDALRQRYSAQDADPQTVELMTWPTTGAPAEHSGFGRVSNDAKNLQTAFLARHLGATPPAPTP